MEVRKVENILRDLQSNSRSLVIALFVGYIMIFCSRLIVMISISYCFRDV